MRWVGRTEAREDWMPSMSSDSTGRLVASANAETIVVIGDIPR